jgi:hypothetical protein
MKEGFIAERVHSGLGHFELASVDESPRIPENVPVFHFEIQSKNIFTATWSYGKKTSYL